jgi:general secretion pathway protein G
MIIAILAGMMMLATGAATDGAEATRVINDLRAVKGASLMFFVDHNKWPDEVVGNGQYGSISPFAKSLDTYLDRPLVGATNARYADYTIGSGDLDGTERAFLGLTLTNINGKAGIKKKLAATAENSGLYGSTGTAFQAYTDEGTIYVVIH